MIAADHGEDVDDHAALPPRPSRAVANAPRPGVGLEDVGQGRRRDRRCGGHCCRPPLARSRRSGCAASRKAATATSLAALSAAGATPPASPAARATPTAGKRAASTSKNSSGRPPVELHRRRDPGQALAVGDGQGDGDAHVGDTELRHHRAVDELDEGVDDAGRVDDHVDARVGHVEQEVRLDDLQPLVHHRRRVDRDLRAHRPGGVTQRLRDGDRREGRRVALRGTGRRWR